MMNKHPKFLDIAMALSFKPLTLNDVKEELIMEKLCKTCLYGLKAEDGKTACTYSGICHSPEGEKTAYRPNKALQYAEVVGRKFRPTFDSSIDHFTIRGYDEEQDMVLTTAHPKEGSQFDDEIEERYLMGAFETGDYEAV